MKFSYRVGDRYLLRNIEIPIQGGKFIILTGKENREFSLIGGIISGMFPLKDHLDIPHLEELIKYFNGDIEVVEGEVPISTSYLGPDPEKHLLFSRVKDEIYSRTGVWESMNRVLNRFRLDAQFLKRRISTLSGGERMKLALSITFSKNVECIVLHGVIPWLDREGRVFLLHEIRDKVDKGSCIVLMEQEIGDFQKYADRIIYFDGLRIVPFDTRKLVQTTNRVVKISRKLYSEIGEKSNSQEVVGFSSVYFRYDDDQSNSFFLNNMTFNLMSSKVYGLIGDNGTGKSTIAKLILRIERPERGSIFFIKKELSAVNRLDLVKKVCFVGQFPERQIILSSVLDYKNQAEKEGNILSKILLDRYFKDGRSFPVSTLSTLEFKILSLASSVSMDTRLIIIDEPTWGIDLEGEIRLLEILIDISGKIKDITILIISHHLHFISRLKSEILWLWDGRIYTYESMAHLKKDANFKNHFTGL